MDTSKIKFDLETSNALCALALTVCVDDTVVYQTAHVKEKITVDHDISDADGDHELRLIISGKTQDHTRIDADGNIIEDVVISVSNVTIDDLDVQQLFLDKCEYTHNFNGSQPQVVDSFHGVAGCNGTISFKFSTPIYLWLLENM